MDRYKADHLFPWSVKWSDNVSETGTIAWTEDKISAERIANALNQMETQ